MALHLVRETEYLSSQVQRLANKLAPANERATVGMCGKLSGTGFIREGGIPGEDDVADVLAFFWTNTDPQSRQLYLNDLHVLP